MSQALKPPPEAVLLRRARLARGLSLDEAARLVADMSGSRFSASRWSQLETGYRIVAGGPIPQRATDGRLAQMAFAVGLAPEQLEDAGRLEAAQVLRELERQRGREAGQQEPEPAEANVSPSLTEIARYFRDDSIPLRDRQRRAEAFFRLLPYFMRGEEPPAEFLDEDSPGRETA